MCAAVHLSMEQLCDGHSCSTEPVLNRGNHFCHICDFDNFFGGFSLHVFNCWVLVPQVQDQAWRAAAEFDFIRSQLRSVNIWVEILILPWVWAQCCSSDSLSANLSPPPVPPQPPWHLGPSGVLPGGHCWLIDSPGSESETLLGSQRRIVALRTFSRKKNLKCCKINFTFSKYAPNMPQSNKNKFTKILLLKSKYRIVKLLQSIQDKSD